MSHGKKLRRPNLGNCGEKNNQIENIKKKRFEYPTRHIGKGKGKSNINSNSNNKSQSKGQVKGKVQIQIQIQVKDKEEY